MYNSQHQSPSSNQPSSSLHHHHADNATDYSEFNLVSIAAEASGAVDVSLGRHLDKIHDTIDDLEPQAFASSYSRSGPSSNGNDGAAVGRQEGLVATVSGPGGRAGAVDAINASRATADQRDVTVSEEVSAHGSSHNSTPAEDIAQTTTALMEMAQSSLKAKRACQFCGKTFSHPGSLGRHLDLKRGTRLHPADQVALIRADVKRRGDAVEIKTRRAKRAKVYNSREDVKERARARRRERERMDRARAVARQKFIERIGLPSLPAHPSFAYVVLYFLPPAQWPHDPPTAQTYHQLEQALQPLQGVDMKMFNDYVNKVNVAFEQWSVMNKQSKMEIWAREQRRVAEAALGSLSLYDLGSREIWLRLEEARVLEAINLDSQREDEGDTSSHRSAKKNGDDGEHQGNPDMVDGMSTRIETSTEDVATSSVFLPASGIDDGQVGDAVLDPEITKHPSSLPQKSTDAGLEGLISDQDPIVIINME